MIIAFEQKSFSDEDVSFQNDRIDGYNARMEH